MVISAAWHRLDPELAVPEITRVLRVGGVLGVIWNSRDGGRPGSRKFTGWPRVTPRRIARRMACAGSRRRREVTFPAGTPMSAVEEHTVEYPLPMTKDELVGLLGTYSGVITLGPERRACLSRRVRAFLDGQRWDRIDLPMVCRCLRSRRLPG